MAESENPKGGEYEQIEGLDLFPKETQEQSKNRAVGDIKRVLRDYSWDWSFLQEPLQNAIDSYIDVNTFQTKIPADHDAIVELEIDFNKDTILFRDYGVGISKDNFNWIRDTNITSKKPSKFVNDLAFSRSIKGFAGIGIKSTLFRSNKFELVSTRDGVKTRLNVENGFDFENKPTDEKLPLQTIDVEDSDRSGTVLKISFPEQVVGKKVTQSLVELMVDEWMSCLSLKMVKSNSYKYQNQKKTFTINETGLHIIEWYLRTQTYAACVTRSLGDLKDKCPDVHIDVKIIGAYGYKNVKFKPGEHDFPVAYWSPTGILSSQSVGGLSKNIRTSRLKLDCDLKEVAAAKGSHQGYFEIIEVKSEIKNLLVANKASKSVQSFCDEFVNGMILYVANPEILRRDLKLPSNPQLGHSTRRLTVNGVPTRHNIQFEFHNYPVTHFVLDIDATVTPDKGHFTGGFRGRTSKMLEDKGLQEFTLTLQSIFSKLGPKVANKIRRRDKSGNIVDDPDFEHKPVFPEEKSTTAKILSRYFARKALITQEQDVIQAFAHYCAIKEHDIGWVSIHEKADLDAWIAGEEWVKLAKSPQKEAGHAILEFKRTLNQILDQDKNQIGQTLDQIDLIVVNDLPTDLTEGYSIIEWYEDELGLQNQFYPEEETCNIFDIRLVWQGTPDFTKKKIRDSKRYALVISLQSIMNNLEDEFSEEE
jgi:hypothetical protein